MDQETQNMEKQEELRKKTNPGTSSGGNKRAYEERFGMNLDGLNSPSDDSDSMCDDDNSRKRMELTSPTSRGQSSRRRPRTKMIRESSTPLFHHSLAVPRPLTTPPRGAKTGKPTRSRKLVQTLERDSLSPGAQPFYSVDGTDDDNKQLAKSSPVTDFPIVNPLDRPLGARSKTYNVNFNKTKAKAAASMGQKEDCVPEKKGWNEVTKKWMDIIVRLHGVYYHAACDLLVQDLTKGWSKAFDQGKFSVTNVRPEYSDDGHVLICHVLDITWERGTTTDVTVLHLYHTTSSKIMLQGNDAEDLWEHVLDPLFRMKIEESKKLRELKTAAQRAPGAAAEARTTAMMGQRQNRGICQFCKTGNFILLHPCKTCDLRGHMGCLKDGSCETCRNRQLQPDMEPEIQNALTQWVTKHPLVECF